MTLDQHLAWMKRQHELGKILFPGPTRDRKVGIDVIRADSRRKAEGIAAKDPYTEGGICTYDLYEWDVHQIFGVGGFGKAG